MYSRARAVASFVGDVLSRLVSDDGSPTKGYCDVFDCLISFAVNVSSGATGAADAPEQQSVIARGQASSSESASSEDFLKSENTAPACFYSGSGKWS